LNHHVTYQEANPDPEDKANKSKEPNIAQNAFKEVFGFFQGMSRL
jgi:hypothetical protein